MSQVCSSQLGNGDNRIQRQRLSRRLGALASDSQIWKSAYYDRFVRPRALRFPGFRGHDSSANKSPYFSPRILKWLGEDHLLVDDCRTDWKKQYKLRHNWAKGNCNVSETRVADGPSIPPLLVQLHGDTIVTADTTTGLRAWRTTGEQRLLTCQAINQDSNHNKAVSAPTSLAVDLSGVDNSIRVVIGFSDGAFSLYELDEQKAKFALRYSHPHSSNGSITAAAYHTPYLLTMTYDRLLSLYSFQSKTADGLESINLAPPRLLSSLKSQTAWPPLSLAIRVLPNSLFASIAYAMPTYLAGWSVGLQELLLTSDGTILGSRLASAETQGFTPLAVTPSHSSSENHGTDPSPSRNDSFEEIHPSRPTSLSYTHPYLLAAHADNTLTLYLINSTSDNLCVGQGRRLWGHTSSVSGACIGDRGKAVSVSKRGNEIRVWELEGGISANAAQRRVSAAETSVQIRPESTFQLAVAGSISWSTIKRSSHAISSSDRYEADSTITKSWVAFNQDTVIVLREEHEGAQHLTVYDFT